MIVQTPVKETEYIITSPAELNFKYVLLFNYLYSSNGGVRYLSTIFPNLQGIFCTISLTEVTQLDPCSRVWHVLGDRGPFFLLKANEAFYLVVLNQNKKEDLIKEINSQTLMESRFVSQNKNYFYFRESKDKIFSFWFSNPEDLNKLTTQMQQLFQERIKVIRQT